MIAALFVDERGPYASLEGVDAWGKSRDARLYAGPWPVVAHPPCERWGRYATGGPSVKVKRIKADDDGCFASALCSVRSFGGVLEHPADSYAWEYFDLVKPPYAGGWVECDEYGWTCRVDQGRYGHKARKATWLYAVTRVKPIELDWTRTIGAARLDAGYHSSEERRQRKAMGELRDVGKLSLSERVYTPIAFRDVLLSIARNS